MATIHSLTGMLVLVRITARISATDPYQHSPQVHSYTTTTYTGFCLTQYRLVTHLQQLQAERLLGIGISTASAT
jgi:hypothetical protein